MFRRNARVRGSALSREEKRRIYRRRRLTVATVLVIVFVTLLMGTALGAAHLTSGSGMCQRCHEMQPYYQSWQHSAHKSVECAQCHIPSGTVGLLLAKIGALREVYVHFAGDGTMPLEVRSQVPRAACLSCHPKPTDATYASSSFTHGAHTSGACSNCHKGLFHPTAAPAKPVPAEAKLGTMDNCLTCHNGTTAPKTCSMCHKAPHAAFGECGLCHTEKSWDMVSAAEAVKRGFAHPFALDGGHATLKCASCHKTFGTAKAAATLPTKCVGCHGDKHRGLTDCAKCHKTSGWTPSNFTHPSVLDGAHATLKCASCHKTFGTAAKAAAPLPTKCVGCHGDKHQGLTDCAKCHKTGGWSPANFSHPGVSGMNWRGMACSGCHPNGYASATCTKCHDSNSPSGD